MGEEREGEKGTLHFLSSLHILYFFSRFFSFTVVFLFKINIPTLLTQILFQFLEMNVLIRNECASVTFLAAILGPHRSIWAKEVQFI
jgi:hypothetical protein